MVAPHSGSLPGSLPFPLGGSLVATVTAGSAAEVGRNLKLSPDGDLVVEAGQLQMVSGLDSVAQDIRCAMAAVQTFDSAGEPNGEWAFDRTVGLPWLRDILVKNPDLTKIREIFRRCILVRQGVVDVPSLTLDYDPSARTLGVTFVARVELERLAGTIAGTVAGGL